MIYRYRNEFGPTFQRSRYPDRVVISWSYQSESGMPARDERESMDRMEDLLAPQVVPIEVDLWKTRNGRVTKASKKACASEGPPGAKPAA